MIIKIHRHDRDFAQISNNTLRDKRLSFKARGLLAYLLSQSDTWNFNVKDCSNHSTDGRAAIYSAMKELKRFGYATLHKEKRGNRFFGSYTLIREIPVSIS